MKCTHALRHSKICYHTKIKAVTVWLTTFAPVGTKGDGASGVDTWRNSIVPFRAEIA